MVGITFDPDVGLQAPETADIREEIVSLFKQVFSDDKTELNTTTSSPLGQLIDSLTALIAAKNAEILYLANMFNPNVSEGIWQDALAQIYFITRKTQEGTAVTCQCTGLQGTLIPAGSIVEDVNGYRFKSLGSVTIPSTGVIDCYFQCTTPGEIDVGENSVNKIITVIPGWDTVNNDTAGVLGWLTESRANFEHRRRNSVAKNSRGSCAALYSNLYDLQNVLGLTILENYTSNPKIISNILVPDHSICICIYGGEDAEIAKIIYNKKDAGCGMTGNTDVVYYDGDYAQTYKILRPSAIDFKVKVEIRNSDYLPSDIDKIIKRAIVNDCLGKDTHTSNPRIEMGDTIYASRFVEAVEKTAGITEILSIQLRLGDSGSWSNMVEISANTMPVATEDNVTVVITEIN